MCFKHAKQISIVFVSLLWVTASASASIGNGDTATSQHSKKVIVADPTLAPLPIEKTGRIEVLPSTYPESWMFVDESSFSSMFGGKMIVLDVAEKVHGNRIKGTADKNLVGNFLAPKVRKEFYIVESFHARGSRGPKTEYLVIYDKTTLSPVKEILLERNRMTTIPRRNAIGISKDEKFLYIGNFSPAASFTVVDLDTREIVQNVGTPGCVLPFSTGKRSITSICSNGSLLTTVLDDTGHKQSQHRIAQFFDTDTSPIFERPTIVNEVAYFPSFLGELHIVDLSKEVASYQGKWSLISEQERQEGWRPGGIALSDSDEQGLMYIIMNPKGFDGSQTMGGAEVWIYDLEKKQRISKVAVPKWAVSVAVTRGKKPLLVVTNGEMALDIFDPRTGELKQNISDFGNITPIVIYKAY